MKRVKITFNESFPLSRQLPSKKFDGIEFIINEKVNECDMWVVYDTINHEETVSCPKENVILFTGEPSTVRTYNYAFLKQFYTIYSCQKKLIHDRNILSPPSLPWLVGIEFNRYHKNYDKNIIWTHDDFANSDFKRKTKLISVITSNKILSRGHKRRLLFVEKLKKRLGDKLDIFGHGFTEIPDKLDALKDYKYSLVIENSSHDFYWTEKLSDAYLCESFPIYYGCSNIASYFSEKSLEVIDINKPNTAILQIEQLLDKSPFYERYPYILQSKKSVLYEYNFFYRVAELLKNGQSSTKSLITLRPEKTNLIDKIHTRINRIF